MKKSNIYSGFHPILLVNIAIAICLLLVAGAYLYAYIVLDKAASQTLIVGIPCALLAVALMGEVIYLTVRKE